MALCAPTAGLDSTVHHIANINQESTILKSGKETHATIGRDIRCNVIISQNSEQLCDHGLFDLERTFLTSN
jgi:hypothetical protein